MKVKLVVRWIIPHDDTQSTEPSFKTFCFLLCLTWKVYHLERSKKSDVTKLEQICNLNLVKYFLTVDVLIRPLIIVLILYVFKSSGNRTIFIFLFNWLTFIFRENRKEIKLHIVWVPRGKSQFVLSVTFFRRSDLRKSFSIWM